MRRTKDFKYSMSVIFRISLILNDYLLLLNVMIDRYWITKSLAPAQDGSALIMKISGASVGRITQSNNTDDSMQRKNS